MAHILEIEPADLQIDEENPRIAEPNIGQHRALETLAESLGGPKLRTLAAHIVENGLNPSELSIVMPLGGGDRRRYRVLEGNRRLAAIRALENPESVADVVSSGVLKELRRLSRDYQNEPLENIPCVVVKDREEARPWIQLKHTGENAGAGVVRWGGAESGRFRERSGAPRGPHIQALDFLEAAGKLTREVRRRVAVTTFERLIDSPVIRARLGVDVRQGQFTVAGDQQRTTKALMYVVSKLASGDLTVSHIHTKEQREKFAADLPASIAVPLPSEKTGDGKSKRAGTASKARRRTGTGKRHDRLIPLDCNLEITDQRLQDIAGELRQLSLENHTNAVSVLFRVFIELTMDCYLGASPDIAVDEEHSLAAKMKAVVDDLVSRKKVTKQQAQGARRAYQKDSLLAPSIRNFHDWVHNRHSFPVPSDLRAHWNNLQPFLVAAWGHISDAAGQEDR